MSWPDGGALRSPALCRSGVLICDGPPIINFGALFGERERGLVESAWKDYQLVLTLDEAHEWLLVFIKTYPDFARWRHRHFKQCEAAGCIVIGRDAAKGVGRIFPASRIPPGKSLYTRSCNLPIQGGCADASMLTLAAVDQALYDAGVDDPRHGVIAWVHDEILLEVPADAAPLAKQLLERAMLDAFEQTFPGSEAMGLLSGLADVSIGDSWAQAKEKPRRKRAENEGAQRDREWSYGYSKINCNRRA
jgi:DNA polymerase I-like protein with 3'-5' exonuclease and polymerase domains